MQNLQVCKVVVGHGDVHEEWSVLELRAARWEDNSSLAELSVGWERRSHPGRGGHISRATCDSQVTFGDAGRGVA